MLEELSGLIRRLGFPPEKVQRVVIQGDRWEVWVLEGKERQSSTERSVLRVHRGFASQMP